MKLKRELFNALIGCPNYADCVAFFENEQNSCYLIWDKIAARSAYKPMGNGEQPWMDAFALITKANAHKHEIKNGLLKIDAE